MKTRSIIAFPEKLFDDKNLNGFQTTRLRVNGEICIGIPLSQFEKACKLLGVTKKKITRTKTDCRGIYFAKFKNDAKEKDNKEKKDTALRRRYMALCDHDRRSARFKTLQSAITKLQSNIELYQRQLVSALRDLEKKQQTLQAMCGADESSTSRYGDDFDRLLEHPDIEKIEITGNKITVCTKTIFISYYGSNYKIGKFKVTINTTGSDGCVKMINLTGKQRRNNYDDYGDAYYYHHPHIDENGRPCLGNIQEALPHMIAEHKYPAAIAVCIQYLKSYEKSEEYRPYADITNWPVEQRKAAKK